MVDLAPVTPTLAIRFFRWLILNLLTVGCGASGSTPARETLTRGFEVCVTEREPGPTVQTVRFDKTNEPIFLRLPPALDHTDLRQAAAVTKTSFFLLSGNHAQSTLVLTLKPTSAERFRATVSATIAAGGQFVLLLHGTVVGRLILTHALDGDELAIPAAFFSQGTEKQRVDDTKALARQIQAMLR